MKTMIINNEMLIIIEYDAENLFPEKMRLDEHEYVLTAWHLCSRDPNEINEKLKLAEFDQQQSNQWFVAHPLSR